MKKFSFYCPFAVLSIFSILTSCKKDDTSYKIPQNGLVCYYEFSGNAKDISSCGIMQL